MSPLRRTFAAFIIAAALWPDVRASEFEFPPISGELSGNLRAMGVPGTPPVAWTLKISPLPGGRRRAVTELTTSGARLKATAEMDLRTGDGTWEITESELDAGTWLAILSPQLGTSAANLVAGGNLKLSGSGVVKKGKPSGAAKLVWTDGSVRNTRHNWALNGITLHADLSVDPENLAAMKSRSPWELSVKTITSTRFGARNLEMRAQFNDDRTVSLLSARVELAGGQVTIDPSIVSLFPPILDFTIRVDRVGLQDLVALVPARIADAQGRIDGVVRVGWSNAAGVQIGEGQFDLRNDETALLRLASAPGFLTKQIPERLSLLPKWTGSLGRLIAPKNPLYPDVREIELGHTQLQITSFGLKLMPHLDTHSRSALVSVSARPTQAGGAVKAVHFDLNISGPVSELLHLSTEDRTSFEVR
ncbi:MAG: YdbH domain-containing protein [Opitutus sp.]